MAKPRLTLDDSARVPFEGLEVHQVDEVDIQQVGGCVWVFLKRQDGSLLRVWIGAPPRLARSTDVAGSSRINSNRRQTRPLTVTVETDRL